ncbi:glutaredoxin family protein [Ottowia sp.]|uniref:glutaredoxin family protein n=1 Tax=Ottowia sp. TaxID=1898956 RepID=UPI003A8A013D
MPRPSVTRALLPIAPVAALLLAAATAQAQVYRNVGADGRITYTDRPVADAAAGSQGRAGDSTAGGAALPYQLNQTAQRYPVTLYSGNSCAACNTGRNQLIQRGIPFTEKTVESNEDIAALQRLTGGNQLPVLTIGGQRLSGYSDAEWTQYLDAAGYPKSSQLPSSYQRPAATPLTTAKAAAPAAQPAAAAPATSTSATAQEPGVSPRRNANNPAGIRF